LFLTIRSPRPAKDFGRSEKTVPSNGKEKPAGNNDKASDTQPGAPADIRGQPKRGLRRRRGGTQIAKKAGGLTSMKQYKT
jgi:hypothetical protein